ncbi:putative steryl acetyl hydrolase mug81 [Hypsizygus marmoreus]|uniref:Steryl acetyl hydrolase mug81 n=1 Tax=Hypsizygus marmoreus TaxID=39966 RepID=A0A369JDZ6_HYPMA|nr:putative steryl acetyl hydrolase mug81 [Hypsizygus marmoreus]
MSNTVRDTSYGNPSWLEKLGMTAALLVQLPPILAWTLLTSLFQDVNRRKNWKRVLFDKACYFISTRLNVKQMQWAMGTTRAVYVNWVREQRLPTMIEDLDDDASLLWIGERRTDRVILYFHGGAYLFSMQPHLANFWKHIQSELKEKNKDVGVAILQFSLVPTASFPTQLKQSVLALQHLISTGIDPRNIQLAGDSAGAGLILQLLSHILHPIPDVPLVSLSSPLGGAFLMSPWVSLTGTCPGGMIPDSQSDMIGADAILYWGREVLVDVPDSQIPYIEALSAPKSWFANIDTAVQRVLVTAGELECLRGGIEVFASTLGEHLKDVALDVYANGVHCEPHFAFLIKEKKSDELVLRIVEWLASGFD